MASIVFSNMLGDAEPSGKVQSKHCPEDVPFVDLTEDSRTLEHLLRFIYPIERPVLSTLISTLRVLAAADKYMIDFVTKEVLEQFKQLAEKEPLRAYAAAFVQRNEAALNVAARACLLRPLPNVDQPAVSEQLESVTVAGYFCLRTYHLHCSVAASAVLRSHATDTSTSEKPWYAFTHDVCEMYMAGQRWWPRDWWARFVESIAASAGATPHPRVVQMLVGRLLERGVRDQHLNDHFDVARALEAFGQEAASDVEAVISAVKLEVRF
ncbi:hypothetical protein PsYK624_005090 [Phanerochaete sordida]|uniref:BTB domain-containing protein n=1 Tax=Phanerochaete sordida TaxID=48140 RepID=A0A9P3L7Y2_9APHY|nr:hypothetical protein PsYK624_005090 [Phanerochaete sordida]